MIPIRASIAKSFAAKFPQYVVQANTKNGRPYHLTGMDTFKYYEVTFNLPDDQYATFRLYFPIAMECVHCLYFQRIPGYKRRRFRAEDIVVFNIIPENGWDKLERWLTERSEKLCKTS